MQKHPIAFWSKWRDSFASALFGADSGSPPYFWRRQRSSALHLIIRASLYENRKAQNLHKQILDFWSKWRDSNSRHPAPKAGALPTALHLDIRQYEKSTQSRRASRCGARKNHRACADLDFFDRCHSLGSLYPPLAAVASLPNCATPG